ncbi:MAG: hypothetical protein M1269_06485 [Chloroflexi bacterium]|nr:hypothetical protein [Chloroflexota bacterium]
MSFSERQGIKPKLPIQVDSMTEGLKKSLWKSLDLFCWKDIITYKKIDLLEDIWVYFFNYRVNDFKKLYAPYRSHSFLSNALANVVNSFDNHTRPSYCDSFINNKLYNDYFDMEWNQVYDFLEYIFENVIDEAKDQIFIDDCNAILEKENSAYRFIGGRIGPVISEQERKEIEIALESPLEGVNEHIRTALKHLSDKKNPDYRNSIKESISAVEAICNIINGEKDTLGQALKKLKDKGIKLHQALEDAFSKLYGYTSDEDGIRHYMIELPDINSDDARYMLVTCSAFVNYLISKSGKAGIDLSKAGIRQ